MDTSARLCPPSTFLRASPGIGGTVRLLARRVYGVPARDESRARMGAWGRATSVSGVEGERRGPSEALRRPGRVPMPRELSRPYARAQPHRGRRTSAWPRPDPREARPARRASACRPHARAAGCPPAPTSGARASSALPAGARGTGARPTARPPRPPQLPPVRSPPSVIAACPAGTPRSRTRPSCPHTATIIAPSGSRTARVASTLPATRS